LHIPLIQIPPLLSFDFGALPSRKRSIPQPPCSLSDYLPGYLARHTYSVMANFSLNHRVSSGTDHESLTHPFTHGGDWGDGHLTATRRPYIYSFSEPARSDFQGTPIDRYPLDDWQYSPNHPDMAPEPQTVFHCRPSALPMNH
jgi:hypothetical protein